MVYKKLTTENLTERFVRSFAETIICGECSPGEQIASEGEIARRFGVSRTVVREGIRELTVQGLLIKKQGRCSMVAPKEMWDLMNPLILATLLTYDSAKHKVLNDLFDVRMLMECYTASQAALCWVEEDMQRINEQLKILETSIDNNEVFMEADLAIHAAIHTAAHNLVAASIMRMIQELLRIGRTYTVLEIEAQRSALAQHQEIVHTITARDPNAAYNAMQRHLTWSRQVSELSFENLRE